MSENYILVGREPKPVEDILEWAAWYEGADRRVALTKLENYRVSTVFLGLDHSFGEGPPLLFETMVFPHDDRDDKSYDEVDCERCTTWEQAEEQHEALVAKWSKPPDPTHPSRKPPDGR